MINDLIIMYFNDILIVLINLVGVLVIFVFCGFLDGLLVGL